MAKELVKSLKLLIPAGKANPAPPLGPMLGQNGIDIQSFCSEFNEKTRDMGDSVIPVIVHVYKDRSFKMVIKKPTVVSMLKKKANIQKGSSNPSTNKVGKISKQALKEIAEIKLADFNTNNLDSAIKIVEGTAKSLGLEITD
ncbi:MAG: 50S ribosomal protein L11 [Candidatus Dojkabacteria bacterium]|nr:MAG: 50S ribosomal protein L11 [Candidatus Dojkabacteria bacterium]